MSNLVLSNLIQFLSRKQTVKKIKQKDIMQYFFNLINKFIDSKFINKENKYILKNYKKFINKKFKMGVI